MRRAIQVQYSTVSAEWRITGKSMPSQNDVAAYMTYGTDRANAYPNTRGKQGRGLAGKAQPFPILKGMAKRQMIPEKEVSPMVSEETSYQFAGLAAAL